MSQRSQLEQGLLSEGRGIGPSPLDLAIIKDIIKGTAGTKDQRAAILRIIGQCKEKTKEQMQRTTTLLVALKNKERLPL